MTHRGPPTAVQAASSERPVRQAADQPLREQLWRCVAPAECDSGAPSGTRLAGRTGVRDQRHEARGADCRRFGHPARDLLRRTRRRGWRSAPRPRPGRGAGARLRQPARLARGVHAMAKAQAGGSGWALLSWSPRLGRLVNQWAADHAHGLAGGAPILALDMYEHSYHMDFGTRAAAYVDAVMANLQWDAHRRALPPGAAWRSRGRRAVHRVRRTDAGGGGHFRGGTARCHAARTARAAGCLHDRATSSAAATCLRAQRLREPGHDRPLGREHCPATGRSRCTASTASRSAATRWTNCASAATTRGR